MLSAEAAQAALAERRERSGPAHAGGRVTGVVARAAAGLTDHRSDSAKVVALLDRVGRRGRRLTFRAVLPGLGGELAQLYENAATLTYQSAWDRRPFRAPRAPQLARCRVLGQLSSTAPELVAHAADPVWLARWGAHLEAQSWRLSSHMVGWLLAAAIDAGNDEVFEILLAAIDGTDDVATMGRHVPIALLCAGREEGWERIENLLLGAQRQEGLRQSILEVVDEAHPQALQRMLGLIVEHDLSRFSSIARSAGVWFGLEVFAGDRRRIDGLLSRCHEYLSAPSTTPGDDPLDNYLALWATATSDVDAAIERAVPLLRDADAERRFAAVRFLSETRTAAAIPTLLEALGDDDLRVAAVAVGRLATHTAEQLPASYDAIEALLARLPKRTQELDPVSWFGPMAPLRREDVAALLFTHVEPPQVDRLLPHAKALSSWYRGRLVERMAREPLTAPRREALLAFLADASPEVRGHAVAVASRFELSDEEALALEPLLKRKPGDLRRGILELIAGRGDAWALAAAQRLLTGDEQQRLGAVDLLRRVAAAGSSHAPAARDQLALLGAAGDETELAEATRRAVRDDPLARADERDGFGLFVQRDLTAGVAPRRNGFSGQTSAALRVIALLDELIERHAEIEIGVERWGTHERVLLGGADSLNLRWHAQRLRHGDTDVDLPLRDLWTSFAAELPPDACDRDGGQILRAHLHVIATSAHCGWGETAKLNAALGVRRATLVGDVLDFLVYVEPDERRLACALDAAEDALARMTKRQLASRHAYGAPTPALEIVRGLAGEAFADACPQLARRHWQLERWVSEPPGVTPKLPDWDTQQPRASKRRPLRPPDEVVALALARGAATEADLIDHLVGPRGPSWDRNRSLGALSTPRGRQRMPAADGIAAIVERVRARVVSIELTRGEAPTAAARAVLALRRSGGLDVLVGALTALGKTSLVRGWSSDGEGRAAVFSHMIATSVPGDDDTPERFADAIRSARVADRRLREVACYAPQWARHVEATLQQPGLADAVWWLHAHTKDDHWTVDEDLREDWSRAVAERTALSSQELVEGAVDVAWFAAARRQLGDAELDLLLAAAKYGSTSGGHKRAELFARAMRGDVTEAALLARIAKSRHQDSVRALGLLPLPEADEREATLARRYELLQAYKRESRRFGRQRQASEGRATEIAMQNLARTAGFADPVRLTWAMEAHLTADLAGEGVTVEHEGVSVSLCVDAGGRPAVAVRRGDTPLKAVPAKLRKAPPIRALTSRTTELRRQASRIRASLEGAMVRGDVVTGAELAAFHDHVLLWPAISRLVLVGEGTAGFPDHGGRALRGAGGTEQAVGTSEILRIAHPVDLLDLDWPAWQRHVMSERLVQPFKQVFRELYLPVDAERTDDGASRRYAGHQVQPGRARALLTGRGWRLDEGEGARRIDHHEQVIASLWFLDGYGSPLDVEAPTLEEVHFHDSREHRRIDIGDVPPRLFSEVMRDLDLVVSVAHVAGVDPEASQSSLQIRAALVAETCELLGLDNVELQGSRALVDGEIARYSVHLGSAGVHRLPGGSVCIVPVPSQHRGRVFLPFADDDPKTAELIAKVLMLARDRDIRDPTILEQLRS